MGLNRIKARQSTIDFLCAGWSDYPRISDESHLARLSNASGGAAFDREINPPLSGD